jgi:hypothetical protein
MFKWQICYTEMTCSLLFTINIPKSHRRPQCTWKIACEDRVLFGLIFSFIYAGSSMTNVSEQFVSCTHLSSVNSTLDPTSQTKSKKYSVYVPTTLPRQPYRMRHRFIPTSFSTMTDSITYPNVDLSSWITLYNKRNVKPQNRKSDR